MKITVQLLLLLLLFNFTACKNENTSDDQVSSVKEVMGDSLIKKEQLSEEEKPKDSINKQNAVAFLRKYGELNKETQVLIRTRLGNITIQLFEDTPLHRSSFIFLTKMGYFDTTCFYRVVPDFIIQGGESERLDTQRYKAKYKRYKIPPEFN